MAAGEPCYDLQWWMKPSEVREHATYEWKDKVTYEIPPQQEKIEEKLDEIIRLLKGEE